MPSINVPVGCTLGGPYNPDRPNRIGWHVKMSLSDSLGNLLPSNAINPKLQFSLNFNNHYGERLFYGQDLTYKLLSGAYYYVLTYPKRTTSLGNQTYSIDITDGIKDWNYIILQETEDYYQSFTKGVNGYPSSVTITYEYPTPTAPNNLAPVNTTLNPRTPIKFTWNTHINQTGFGLQYRANSESWKTVTQTTSNKFYDMPANTITATSGTLYWRVRVKEDTGVYSNYTEGQFTIETPIQIEPVPLSPIGAYKRDIEPVQFSWMFVADTIETQSEYTLEYSKNNGETWARKTGTTADTTTINFTNSISTTVLWKVRVKNNYGDWSNWSTTQRFYLIGIPPKPNIISVSAGNRPTMQWIIQDQESYRIQVFNSSNTSVYDSGKIIGANTNKHVVSKTLSKATYKFTLEVYNQYGIKSEVAEYTQTITGTNEQVSNVDLINEQYCIVIKASSGDVYRDNKRLGTISNGEFRDYTGENKRDYIYTISKEVSGNIITSEEMNGCVNFNRNTLAPLSQPNKFTTLYYRIDENEEETTNVSYDNAQFHLSGRELPVFVFGEHKSITKSFKFYVDDPHEFEQIIKRKEQVLYRSVKGENFIGTITSYDKVSHFKGYNINFTIVGSDNL